MKLDYLSRGLPGHPLHPPLTDATIGIYTFATIAAVLSKLGIAEEPFAHGWWLALVVGLVSTVPTALAGLVDWLTISSGTPLKRTATGHALAMVTATVFFLITAIVGHGDYHDANVGAASLILTLVGFGFLTLGGTWGGSVVYVHGMRVLNLTEEPSRRAMTPSPAPEKEMAEGS